MKCWPWRRKPVQDREPVEQAKRAELRADQQLQNARQVADEMLRLADESEKIRNRNHFGDAILASFGDPVERRWPWQK